jgi:hypothetical protein
MMERLIDLARSPAGDRVASVGARCGCRLRDRVTASLVINELSCLDPVWRIRLRRWLFEAICTMVDAIVAVSGTCNRAILSRAPSLVLIDADLQHNATLLPRMVPTLKKEEFDIVACSGTSEWMIWIAAE